MGTASPRPRSATFEGHEHARWEPATPLSDEDKRKVERIELGRTDVDFKIKQRLDDLLKELEGDLVPVCTCGWRGLPGGWKPPHSRTRSGSHQQISHELNVRMDLSTQRFARAGQQLRSFTLQKHGPARKTSRSGCEPGPSTS